MGCKHLKLDSVDCEYLVYVMGEWRCLDRRCRVPNAEYCYRCKFSCLKMREDRIRKERERERKHS